MKKKHETLCWSCRKAIGGCSWSKKFILVEGWEAVPTTIKTNDRNGCTYSDSFDVYECPEFELLERLKRK